MKKIITSSWDDGHPADWTLAGLLDMYKLQGTFYIPRSNHGKEVMPEKEIAALSTLFEIGGHTLNHRSLNSIPSFVAVREIKGCFDWLKGIIQTDPVSFCPPFGHYNGECLSVIYRTGFKIIRTTELLSTRIDSTLIPTTLQVYDHSRFTYFRHLLKRQKFSNLGLWYKSGCSDNIFYLLDHYLKFIDMHGGCLHLWGHSWEIEDRRLWRKLEAIFRHISGLNGFTYASNRDLENCLEGK